MNKVQKLQTASTHRQQLYHVANENAGENIAVIKWLFDYSEESSIAM